MSVEEYAEAVAASVPEPPAEVIDRIWDLLATAPTTVADDQDDAERAA